MKRKYVRNFRGVGKSRYKFEFNLEKNIYSNLCLCRIKKKELKKIENKLKFTTYSEWKHYIYNKYKDYDKEFLSEFSRYLNQGIRNIQPGREYLNLAIPIILTIVFTEFIERILEINNILSEFPLLICVIMIPILLIILFVPFFYFIWNTLSPVWDNNIEENLFKDYKEIIDEILKEKLKQEKD